MTLLAMIRHGPTAWNEDKRLQGHTDVPLSERGREIVLGWQLPFEVRQYRWVCSPLRRAIETTELLGVTKFEIEPRLIEMNYGNWEGCRLADLRSELGDEMAKNEARGLDFLPDGGERPRDVQERLTQWLREVAACGQPTAAVSHHGVLRALFSLATGWNMINPLRKKFLWGATHLFRIEAGGEVIVERNNVSIKSE